MTNRSQTDVQNYVAAAICPVLIMALVGSLVFFLIEILYTGAYARPLRYVFFCFVFATVLIARLSMGPGSRARSPVYGLALGLVTLLALTRFVSYPEGSWLSQFSWLVNIGLMAIVWWCAHKLTWDCTWIDDDDEASGEGLLDAAGLSEGISSGPPAGTDAETKEGASPADWWQRFLEHRRNRKKRPHIPGVWVVYFSLAALPIFGLGQGLIPQGDQDKRAYVFLLLCIYVASGLGLLLTTTYLGLCRYLRQRRLKMPGTVTVTWLTLGCALVIGFLVVSAILPRPRSDLDASKWAGVAGSKDRRASRHAIHRDSPGKNKGRAATQKVKGRKAQKGRGAQPDDSARSQKQGKRGSTSKAGKSAKDKSPGKDGKRGPQSKGEETKRNDDQTKSDDSQDADESLFGTEGSEDQSSSSTGIEDSQDRLSQLTRMFPKVSESWAKVIRVLAYVVAALVIGYFALRILANFNSWARLLLDSLRGLWQMLFGWRRTAASKGEELAEPEEEAWQPEPFASYSNPFIDGRAASHPPEEIVRYTFAALQAWAWERDIGRSPDETPMEFTDRLADGVRHLSDCVGRLGLLYAHVTYGRRRIPRQHLSVVQELWNRLESTAVAVEDSEPAPA